MFRDHDLDACYDVQPNATCTDCGVDFSRGEDDPTTTCDACSDRRDAHTTLLEGRLAMAKARATVGVPTRIVVRRGRSGSVIGGSASTARNTRSRR